MKVGKRILICFVYLFFQIKLVYFIYKVLFLFQPTKFKRTHYQWISFKNLARDSAALNYFRAIFNLVIYII